MAGGKRRPKKVRLVLMDRTVDRLLRLVRHVRNLDVLGPHAIRAEAVFLDQALEEQATTQYRAAWVRIIKADEGGR